jgi:NADH-quinone oxidoreductase subunit M
MILGAWYLMTMLRRLLFGMVKEPQHHGPPVTDMTVREWLMVAPIVLACIGLGVYPQPILNSTRQDVETVIQMAKKARQRAADSVAVPLITEAIADQEPMSNWRTPEE